MTSSKSPASNTKHGQALIEFCVTAALAMAVAFFGLQFAYYAWAKVWIRHVLYEALICEMEAGRMCEQAARNSLNEFLPFRSQEPEVRLSHRPFWYNGKIRLQINDRMWAGDETTLDHRRLDGGFAFITFLIPLALTILVCLTLLGLVLNERAKQMQICRNGVIAANDKIESGIKKILALNKPIFVLQIARDALEVAKRSDPEPYTLAGILAAIKINEAQQKFMASQQRLFKQSALGLSRASLFSLKGEAALSGAYGLQDSGTQLELLPETTWHTAKQQSRAPWFTERHKIKASWRVSTEKFGNIFRFPNYFSQRLEIACSSSIRREGMSWMSLLSR